MRTERTLGLFVTAPLALAALSACSGDTEGAMAEGEYDPDAPTLEEVSTTAELANTEASTEEPVTNLEVTE